MSARQQATEALAELDRAIAEKPNREGATFSAATRHLCRLRDELARRPADDPTRRGALAHVNGIITAVLAAHFPLGGVQWEELERARAWLADFVAGAAA